MKLGSNEVSGSLFKLARDQMLNAASFTPRDIQEHVLAHGQAALAEASSIPLNQRIVAIRVTRASIDELKAAGQVRSIKRGVWEKV